MKWLKAPNRRLPVLPVSLSLVLCDLYLGVKRLFKEALELNEPNSLFAAKPLDVSFGCCFVYLLLFRHNDSGNAF